MYRHTMYRHTNHGLCDIHYSSIVHVPFFSQSLIIPDQQEAAYICALCPLIYLDHVIYIFWMGNRSPFSPQSLTDKHIIICYMLEDLDFSLSPETQRHSLLCCSSHATPLYSSGSTEVNGSISSSKLLKLSAFSFLS